MLPGLVNLSYEEKLDRLGIIFLDKMNLRVTLLKFTKS